MKKFSLLGVALLLVIGVFSANLTEVFDTSKANSTIYKTAQADLEITNLDYEKSKIEAVNKKAELASELAFYNGLSSYNTSMKDYYSDILDRVLNVYIEELNLNIANLQLKNAQIDYNNNKALYDRGLISNDDLKNSELNVKDAQTNLETVQLNLETAMDNLKKVYNKDYKQIELKIPEYEGLFVTDEEYLEKNYNLKLVSLNVEMSQYDLNNLPYNVSQYDRRKAEVTHQKNLLTLEDLQYTLVDAHKSTKNTIETLYKTLQNLKERMDLAQSTYNDTKERFDKGLVSEMELNTANINYLTAQKNYYDSLRNYIKVYINYLIDTGRSPEEVGL